MEENKQEKKQTSYDRKMQSKKQEQKKDKSSYYASLIIIVLSVLVIAVIAVISILNKKKEKDADLKEYIKINNESVSKLEFNYYKNGVVNSFASTYQQILPYIGLDFSGNWESTVFDESTGETWSDYFDTMTANAILENKALLADMKAKGVTLDTADNVANFMAGLASTATAGNVTVKEYMQQLYGPAATEKRIRPFVEDEITASMYYAQLTEQTEVSDEAVQAEYDSNPVKYDSVDYHVLGIPASYSEGASEDEISKAMETVIARANEMLEKVNAGEDFEDLCIKYAPLTKQTEYADGSTELSLETITDLTPNDSYVGYSSWLFSTDRKQGDSEVYVDEENHVAWVLKYERRYYDDSTKTSIRNNLIAAQVNEYVDNLLSVYTVSDPEKHLKFYTAPVAQAE